MSEIREFTDNNIFGNDPENRNVLQAAGRDLSHAVFHLGGAIFNTITGNFDGAAQDLKRAGDHFSGENMKQRKGSTGSADSYGSNNS